MNLASDGGYQALLEDRFSDLRDKLGKAQLLNRQRENDLHILRSQFNYLVQLLSTNQTDNRLAVHSCVKITVNSEIFARILFSQIALKDIFATIKIRDFGMIYLHQ